MKSTYKISLLALCGALVSAGCGEKVTNFASTARQAEKIRNQEAVVDRHEVEVEIPSPEEKPSEQGPANQPGMITGGYLTICQWKDVGKVLQCMISATANGAPLKAENIAVEVREVSGILIETSSYQMAAANLPDGVLFDFVFSKPNDDINIKFTQKGPPEVVVAQVQSYEIRLENRMIAYEGRAFSGKRAIFAPGSYGLNDNAQFAAMAPTVVSLRMAPLLAVRVCGQASAEAALYCRDYSGEIADLQGMQGQIVSMEVYNSKPFVTLFHDLNLEGPHAILAAGEYSGAKMLMAGSLSSIHIPASLVVDACLGADGKSDCVRLPKGSVNFTEALTPLNEQVHFLRIAPAAGQP